MEDACLLFDSPPPFLERWAAYLCYAGRREDKASRERTPFDSGAGILEYSMGFGCALSSLERPAALRTDVTTPSLPGERTSPLHHCPEEGLHHSLTALRTDFTMLPLPE